MKNIKNFYKRVRSYFSKISWVLASLFVSAVAFADDTGYIPISSNDTIQSGESFTHSIGAVFKNDIIPFIQMAAAIAAAVIAIITLFHGINETRAKRDSEPLKTSLGHIVIVIIFTGLLIALLSYISGKIPTT